MTGLSLFQPQCFARVHCCFHPGKSLSEAVAGLARKALWLKDNLVPRLFHLPVGGGKREMKEPGKEIEKDELSCLLSLQIRSEIIATYALCGFSNFSAIGIQLGGLGPMAPNRRGDMATVALRALLAGSMACFMTACVAGKSVMDR